MPPTESPRLPHPPLSCTDAAAGAAAIASVAAATTAPTRLLLQPWTRFREITGAPSVSGGPDLTPATPSVLLESRGQARDIVDVPPGPGPGLPRSEERRVGKGCRGHVESSSRRKKRH